ncbi:MAG TPA: cupredoxin domain-containing protein [Mycobacteriales bacterium]|nr:cupredoxin domain-containing protein [Mycobacteriales bacterium]
MRVHLVAALAVTAAALTACSDGADKPSTAAAPTRSAAAAATPAPVEIVDFRFAPKSLRVAAGTAITWVNRDDAVHSVVAGDRTTFTSEIMNQGDEFSFTPDAAGTLAYICGVHQYMTGEIVVT